jgi:transposase
MRAGLFWLNDRQWACIAPHLPTNLTGPERDDDRRIISGIIHMLQCGARWRDRPPEYGPYLQSLQSLGQTWTLGGDLRGPGCRSTPPRSRRIAPPAAEKGGHEQAIGRSRGGRTTKIHALCDPDCRPRAFHLTPSQDADISAALALLALTPPMCSLIVDKGYDGDEFSRRHRQPRSKACHPKQVQQNSSPRFNKRAYKGRNVIEPCFCRLKR